MSDKMDRADVEDAFQAMVEDEIAIAKKWSREGAKEFLELVNDLDRGPTQFSAFLESARHDGDFDLDRWGPESMIAIGIYYILFAVYERENFEMHNALSNRPIVLSDKFSKWARAMRYLAEIIEGGPDA